MEDTELIAALAKRLSENTVLLNHYRQRCEELETALRVRENITESNDPLPLDAVGTANKIKMEEPHV